MLVALAGAALENQVAGLAAVTSVSGSLRFAAKVAAGEARRDAQNGESATP